jgi:Ca2+-binding RTX toxin-like protein
VPQGTNDEYETSEDTALILPAPGVLRNDTDVDHAVLGAVVVSPPHHGRLTLQLDGGLRYVPDSNYFGPDSFTYRPKDDFVEGDLTTVSVAVSAVNDVPNIVLSPSLSVLEGQPLTILGSFSDPDAGDSWTATVDYGDGSATQSLALKSDNTFELSHFYRDDGRFMVTVVVTDVQGATGSATTVVLVRNVAPQIVSFAGPAAAKPGQSLQFVGIIDDPGRADAVLARIDWGDGRTSFPASSTLVSNLLQITASHAYRSGGIFHPVLTITDGDGGSALQTISVLVAGVGVNRGVLEIVGSAAADTVTITGEGSKLRVFGSLGGVTLSHSFVGVQRIVAALGGGRDIFNVSAPVKLPALIDGGTGNDTLRAGGGPSILVGGPGNDALRGSNRRDLLIGGVGADLLNGSGGSDLVIAGRTSYDADYEALAAIFADWNAAGGYQNRIARLRTGTGSSTAPLGIRLVVNQTIFDDGVADTIWGDSDLDWFFSEVKRDKVKDKVTSESLG